MKPSSSWIPTLEEQCSYESLCVELMSSLNNALTVLDGKPSLHSVDIDRKTLDKAFAKFHILIKQNGNHVQ